MTPLAPAQKNVLRVRGAIAALILLIAAGGADFALSVKTELPFGLLTGAAFLLGLILIFYVPPRRYASWGYEEAEDELHVWNGIFLRTHTIVPFGRVQHIDLSHGPIERRYGVAAITLHTAGTRASAVVLPGLATEDAERMRDGIRAKIRQDLV